MSVFNFKKKTKKMEPREESRDYQKVYDWFDKNKLEIGSLKEFIKGQKDFSSWGAGIIAGHKDKILQKLCSRLRDLNASEPSLEKTSNYSWQQSNLEDFTVRIQASLSEGTLAGYYIGRIGEEQYALFGYGFDDSEGLPEKLPEEQDVTEPEQDIQDGGPLDYNQLFWYGFNRIVIGSSTQEEIVSLLGPGAVGDWLQVDGNPIGRDCVKLSYPDLGITFFLKKSILNQIEVDRSWKGNTEGGIHPGSSTREIEILMDNLDINDQAIGAVLNPSNFNERIAITLGRTVDTPRNRQVHFTMAFYLETPISLIIGIPKPPFPEIQIIKITVSN